MHEESLYAERALRAGARGYITKQEGGAKLMQAIRQVLGGQIYVSEKMSARIVEIFSGQSAGGTQSPVAQLSDREFEVFQLIGQALASRNWRSPEHQREDRGCTSAEHQKQARRWAQRRN